MNNNLELKAKSGYSGGCDLAAGWPSELLVAASIVYCEIKLFFEVFINCFFL
jgi:hypothetical protein